MKTSVVVVVVVCLAFFATAHGKDSTPVKPCGQEKLFKNVAIYTSDGLCQKLPCRFRLGENITAVIEFENKDVVEKIVSKCTATVLANDIDFDVPDADRGCDMLVNAACPVAPGTNVEMKLVVPVRPPIFGSLATVERDGRFDVDVKLTFELVDQKKDVISCFRMTSKVSLM